MLQRELPQGVYPDGAPSAFFSTADMDSVAKVAASGYSSLSRIYDNYFVATADEKIDDWVLRMFGTLFDPSTPLQTKRDRVLTKIRSQPTLNRWQIMTIVAKYLPEGKFVQVYHACGNEPGNQPFWLLGVSLLGIDTRLAGLTADEIGITEDNILNWCKFISTLHWRLGEDGLGENTYLSYINWIDLASFMATAFQYEIRIYDYTLPANDLAALEVELQNNEPARSAHIIKQNQDLATSGLNTIVPNATQFSGVDCIDNDSTSTTGYTGRKF